MTVGARSGLENSKDMVTPEFTVIFKSLQGYYADQEASEHAAHILQNDTKDEVAWLETGEG